ncbi:MAG TPA: hypothetical protein VJ732_07830 [Bryobacteraceae bacterium]|nr:hypothetical protein [Bryobacteraceae bacterium]
MNRSLVSEAARAMNAARKTHAGGRPRSRAPRCKCGVMTLARAQARGKSREHKPYCTYYRAGLQVSLPSAGIPRPHGA